MQMRRWCGQWRNIEEMWQYHGHQVRTHTQSKPPQIQNTSLPCKTPLQVYIILFPGLNPRQLITTTRLSVGLDRAKVRFGMVVGESGLEVGGGGWRIQARDRLCWSQVEDKEGQGRGVHKFVGFFSLYFVTVFNSQKSPTHKKTNEFQKNSLAKISIRRFSLYKLIFISFIVLELVCNSID